MAERSGTSEKSKENIAKNASKVQSKLFGKLKVKETSQDHAIECGDEEGQNLPVELNSESSQDKSNENDIEGDQKLPVELNHETSEDNTKKDDDEGGQKLPVEFNQEVQFKIGSYTEVEYELNRGRKKECKKYVGEIIDAVDDEPYVSFLDN